MTLKEKYKDYFDVGAAVNNETIRQDKDIILDYFSMITCENEMKYGSILRRDGSYNYSNADEIYAFAKDNGLKMRGHNFVWHNQTAYNIFDNDVEYVIQVFSEHVKNMHERYGDIITAWDVVNEAIEDKSSEYLRKSPWYSKLGDNYIKKIFEIVSGIIPSDVTLLYNDYNEYIPDKREKIIRLIKEVNSDEKLIDAVGMQCHVNLYYPSIDLVRETIELYISLGLRIQITEMDLSYYKFEDKGCMDKPSKELEEKHAKMYGDYFALFREYKDYIDSVTLWGVADSYTWLDDFPVRGRKNWPLLFDENGKPKDSYYRIMDF